MILPQVTVELAPLVLLMVRLRGYTELPVVVQQMHYKSVAEQQMHHKPMYHHSVAVSERDSFCGGAQGYHNCNMRDVCSQTKVGYPVPSYETVEGSV